MIVTLLLHWWHRLFHGDMFTHVEHADGRVFVRCRACGLRTDGVEIGPMKTRSYLAGDKRRFALDAPTAVVPFEYEQTPEFLKEDSEAMSGHHRVH